jgi:hypothetical protein
MPAQAAVKEPFLMVMRIVALTKNVAAPVELPGGILVGCSVYMCFTYFFTNFSYYCRYRLCYIGSDGTGEVELVFFDKAAKELVGKGALTLIRSRAPAGVSVEDAIQIARADQSIPREIASIVSRKYRFVVSVTTRSFDPECIDPSYQVHRIEIQHGKQPRSTTLGRGPGLALASPSKSVESGGLNSDGDALAMAAMLGQNKSSSSVTGLSDAPESTDLPASMVSARMIGFLAVVLILLPTCLLLCFSSLNLDRPRSFIWTSANYLCCPIHAGCL